MDIAAFTKNLDLKMENRRKRLEIGKIIQDYNDARQGLAIEREEQFKPIVDEVKQVKETIDEKQDRLIKKLDENQKAITQDLSWLRELEDTFESPPESPLTLEPPPKPKTEIYDPDKNFSQEELDYIKTIGFPTPNDAFSRMRKDDLDLDRLENDVKDKIWRAGRSKGGLSKDKVKNKDEIEDLTRQINTLKKYIDRINRLAGGNEMLVTQKGNGLKGGLTKRKYTQKKRNAYKIERVQGAGLSKYGSLLINPLRLLKEMVVEATDPVTGAVVFERQGDKGIVDLLTKRFNPKTNYSQKALQIFNDLSKLANIPMHKSSGKSKLLRGEGGARGAGPSKSKLLRGEGGARGAGPSKGGAIFSDVKDLTDRLVKLTGSMKAGNSSLQVRNEATEILDHLLRKNEISKKQYNAYTKRYFS